MSKFLKVVLLVCSAVFISNVSVAGDFSNVKPLFKDGKLITGAIEIIDEDLDGMPDRLKVSYKVWDVGTKNLQLRTRKRKFPFPQATCLSPDWEDTDVRFKFSGANSANRVHMAGEISTYCGEWDGEEIRKHRVVLYSGNINDGTSWAKTWPDYELEGMNSVNWDADGTDELMVVMRREKAGGMSVRVVFINPSDGVVESDKTYPRIVTQNF